MMATTNYAANQPSINVKTCISLAIAVYGERGNRLLNDFEIVLEVCNI